MDRSARTIAVLTVACGLSLGSALSHAVETSGLAWVQEDGTLRVSGKTIRLYGIHIPPMEESCRSHERPLRCGTWAELALEDVAEGFVHCQWKGVEADRTVIAVCRTGRASEEEGVDLAAYLLERGWALALPEAPFAYHALEKIARSRGLGIWGIAFPP